MKFKTAVLLNEKVLKHLTYGSLRASTIFWEVPLKYRLNVTQESLFLMSHCFAGLMQKILNRDKIQDSRLTPNNKVNILMY